MSKRVLFQARPMTSAEREIHGLPPLPSQTQIEDDIRFLRAMGGMLYMVGATDGRRRAKVGKDAAARRYIVTEMPFGTRDAIEFAGVGDWPA